MSKIWNKLTLKCNRISYQYFSEIKSEKKNMSGRFGLHTQQLANNTEIKSDGKKNCQASLGWVSLITAKKIKKNNGWPYIRYRL